MQCSKHTLTRYSGGAKGWADGAGAGVPAVTCAPAGKGKPLFHSVMQHQLFASHIIIFHTKRGQLFGAHNTREDGIYFESKFSRFSGGNTRAPFAGEGYPHYALTPSNAAGASTCAGIQTIVPLRSYGPHWCHSNKLLAPPLT